MQYLTRKQELVSDILWQILGFRKSLTLRFIHHDLSNPFNSKGWAKWKLHFLAQKSLQILKWSRKSDCIKNVMTLFDLLSTKSWEKTLKCIVKEQFTQILEEKSVQKFIYSNDLKSFFLKGSNSIIVGPLDDFIKKFSCQLIKVHGFQA